MVILGIDPGLATMGYGVIRTENDRHTLLQYGAIKTQAHQPMPQRLRSIFLGVEQLMDIYSPDDVAFEELFFSKNITTGIAVGAARGAALVAVAQKTDNIYEYTPMQVKQAVTGEGKAEKRQVQMMVKMLLRMNEVPQPDDAADALAVAIAHAHCLRARHLYKIQ
ncbi:MAG: crossover junction endodeoxyribonuclease RuvC [Christensenellales bacterium]